MIFRKEKLYPDTHVVHGDTPPERIERDVFIVYDIIKNPIEAVDKKNELNLYAQEHDLDIEWDAKLFHAFRKMVKENRSYTTYL